MGIKVVVACEVEDVANFKSVFELGRVRREEAGIYNSEVYQDIDLKNNIWVITTATSKDAFLALLNSDGQKQRMREAGVISPPTITFLETI